MLFNMNLRPLIAFLLIVVITVAAVGRARAQGDDPFTKRGDTLLAPDEEWEARSIAEQFAKRFEESDDLLSIVDDLYVKDLDDRLRRDPADRFIVPIDSELAEQVKGDELRRCHIASLKFTYLYMMLLASAWHTASYLNGGAKPDYDEREPRLDETLPPRVIALLKNDPAFAEMLLEESKKDGGSKDTSQTNAGSEEQAAVVVDDSQKRAEDKDQTIKNIERLRAYISTLEQAIAIMREHLRTLPVPQTWQSMMDSMGEPGHEPGSDPMKPHATILAGDNFGEPKGARLICLNVMMFRMDLIRVDGQLKILNVYVAGN
jgi:hypothetical protein